LTAIAIATAACSSATGSGGVSPADDKPAVTGSGSPPADETGSSGNGPTAEVLRFSAPRLEGGTVEGEDYSGSDVAFWFWAPW